MDLSERIKEARARTSDAGSQLDRLYAYSHLADLLDTQGSLLRRILQHLRDDVTEEQFRDLKHNTTTFFSSLIMSLHKKETLS